MIAPIRIVITTHFLDFWFPQGNWANNLNRNSTKDARTVLPFLLSVDWSFNIFADFKSAYFLSTQRAQKKQLLIIHYPYQQQRTSVGIPFSFLLLLFLIFQHIVSIGSFYNRLSSDDLKTGLFRFILIDHLIYAYLLRTETAFWVTLALTYLRLESASPPYSTI